MMANNIKQSLNTPSPTLKSFENEVKTLQQRIAILNSYLCNNNFAGSYTRYSTAEFLYLSVYFLVPGRLYLVLKLIY
jgi:hypothetical protein